jgi:nucleoside-diphosphate-sugar epimerase
LSFRIQSGDGYAITKREAEDTAGGFHGKGGLAVTILRPTALFGERDRRFIPMVVRVLKMRLVPLLGSGMNLLAVVYAGNAAEAVVKALDGSGAGDTFNISEDLLVTPRSLFEGLGHELGITPYFLPVPGSLVRTAAVLAGGLGLGVPGVRGLPLTRAVRLALGDNPYSAARGKTVLGWSPRYSLEEALIRTGTWLREKEEGHD